MQAYILKVFWRPSPQKRHLWDVQRPILYSRGGPKKCILHFGSFWCGPPLKSSLKGVVIVYIRIYIYTQYICFFWQSRLKVFCHPIIQFLVYIILSRSHLIILDRGTLCNYRAFIMGWIWASEPWWPFLQEELGKQQGHLWTYQWLILWLILWLIWVILLQRYHWIVLYIYTIYKFLQPTGA